MTNQKFYIQIGNIKSRISVPRSKTKLFVAPGVTQPYVYTVSMRFPIPNELYDIEGFISVEKGFFRFWILQDEINVKDWQQVRRLLLLDV